MIATIDKEGLLFVKAETELEAYALKRWCDESIHECTFEVNKDKIGFDYSLTPLKNE